MILKMNGVIQGIFEPDKLGVGEKIWKSIKGISDNIIQGESDIVVSPVLHFIGNFLVHLNHEFVQILPELAVLIAVICVSIGMFGDFGKWLSRAMVVYFGGAVWMTLSKAV